MKIEDRYAVKSKITGYYLSSLFSDSHNETFAEKEITQHKIYFWNDLRLAQQIADEENGIVVVCKFVNDKYQYSANLL